MSLEKKREVCEIDPSRPCTDCGDCDACDLVEGKVCDNCCRCIGMDQDFLSVIIKKEEPSERAAPRSVPRKRPE